MGGELNEGFWDLMTITLGTVAFSADNLWKKLIIFYTLFWASTWIEKKSASEWMSVGGESGESERHSHWLHEDQCSLVIHLKSNQENLGPNILL